MIEQIVIGICGISSVWLSQDARDTFRKWACIFGLFAEPFWLYSAWKAEQWGIVILVFVYTAGWLKGFRLYWMTK